MRAQQVFSMPKPLGFFPSFVFHQYIVLHYYSVYYVYYGNGKNATLKREGKIAVILLHFFG